MSSPDLTAAEVAAVTRVLGTATLSLGPHLSEFEAQFAAYIGARHAIGVSSGTAGLHLGVIASGVGEGDLVITSSFSFIASANAILYERAVPVFADVDPATGNIKPELVAEAVNDLRRGGTAARRWLPPSLRSALAQGNCYRVKAILPVHTFGQPADLFPLLDLAREHGLEVIEDACEAVGAEYQGRKVGALGDSGVFAFYPNKQITTGEGGMIVTNSDEKAHLFRSLRNQGRDVFDARLCHTRLGYNYRMDELSAALGAAQLARCEELLARRVRVAGWYDERLKAFDWVERPIVAPQTTHMSWFVYVIRVRPPFTRDALMRRLEEVGIASRQYFAPIHLQPFYRERFGYERGHLSVTEHLGDVSLALPFSGVMTEDQVERVCRAIATLERGGESSV